MMQKSFALTPLPAVTGLGARRQAVSRVVLAAVKQGDKAPAFTLKNQVCWQLPMFIAHCTAQLVHNP